MSITSRTHVRLGLDGEATLADLREMLTEADRLGAPGSAKVNHRAALGGLVAGLVVEWTPDAPEAESEVADLEADILVGKMTSDLSFEVDTVGELLGQLVGACSMARFWDEMPTTYPRDAGVFQGDVARRLVEAAEMVYAAMVEPAPLANLGLATTGELLDELRARIEVDYHAGGGGLDYTTTSGRPDPMALISEKVQSEPADIETAPPGHEEHRRADGSVPAVCYRAARAADGGQPNITVVDLGSPR